MRGSTVCGALATVGLWWEPTSSILPDYLIFLEVMYSEGARNGRIEWIEPANLSETTVPTEAPAHDTGSCQQA